MREWGVYVIAGAIGILALGAAVAASYGNSRPSIRATARTSIGSPLTERQALERRRARAADVAIAGTTTL